MHFLRINIKMESNNTTGGSLPSFQTFLFGQNRVVDTANFNGFAPSGFANSGTENPYDYKPQVAESYQTGNSDKQSLYYKECLPSFSNFVNYPPLTNEEPSHHSKSDSNNYETYQGSTNFYQDNYYSSKLNEISQKGHDGFGSHVKSEPETNTYSRGTCLLENAKEHHQYPGYNSQYMNCIPASNMSSIPNLQHYNQTSSMQQYDMFTKIKSENMYGSNNGLYQDHNQSHGYIGQDDSNFAEVDSILLKRKKTTDSKRAKKLKGGIDCNYELCNMWHELANPIDAPSSGTYNSEKSLSSFSSDSESQTELVSKPEGDTEHLSNDTPFSAVSEQKSTLTKPVTIFNFVLDDSIQTTCRQFLEAERKLCQHLKMISFGEPVSHIYNPLVYAFETHLKFLKTFCTSNKSVLFLAMNPGPFGMSQNGVIMSI